MRFLAVKSLGSRKLMRCGRMCQIYTGTDVPSCIANIFRGLTVPAVDKNFELTSAIPLDKEKFNCIIFPAYYFCEYAVRLRMTGQLV